MSVRGPTLDSDELVIAEKMARGQTLRSIAAEVGMSYNTVQEISSRASVEAYVRHELERLRGGARRALTGLGSLAIACLARNMRSKTEDGALVPPSVQVQAAKIVLDIVFDKHRLEREDPAPDPTPVEATTSAQILSGVTDAMLDGLERRMQAMQQHSQGQPDE